MPIKGAGRRGRLADGPLIDVRQIHKVYEPAPRLMRVLLRSSLRSPVVALDGVSLEVHPGRVCAIIGPNGAGKSTLFRILTGLTTATSGEAFVAGLDVDTQSYEVRRHLGFAPAEHNSLLLRHSCMENLLFHGRLQGIPVQKLRKRIREVLELVGLVQVRDRLVVALSSGMRARLLLARAILHRPPVLILDEPTGMVDPIAAFEIMSIIQQLVVDEKLAALISSHRLDEVEALDNDVILLDAGKIVYRGEIASLRKIWEQPRIEIEFASEPDADQAASFFAGLDDVELVSAQGGILVLDTEVPLGTLLTRANGAWSKAHAIRETKMPLRDLMAIALDRGNQSNRDS